MSGYAIEFQGKQFTPEGRAGIADVDAHNKAIEAQELTIWATCPDRWQVYIAKGGSDKMGVNHFMDWYIATTWLGARLSAGRIERSRFQTNISRNMVAIRFVGTNGATYYGRYGSDWSQSCRVRKVKGGKRF